ncbi:MAG: hypothetical protein A2Y33_01745 [Spirochaetes bacterium GWF1_51_8]|nr:MAG: hypothetical protein A2Y33_01745 [Spirochaetes bacterium GWF1_51_8]
MRKRKQGLFAVIDIGSHSIRMTIGEIVRKGSFKTIEHLWVPVLIGRDTFSKGVVSNQTVRDLINVIRQYQEVMKSYQVEDYKAIATSSLRGASNADAVMERVYNSTGIRIEVIEPIQEMEYYYYSVKKTLKDRYGFMQGNTLILSIGGGSTLIMLLVNGKIAFTQSYNQGTLRLLRSYDLPERYFDYALSPVTLNFTNSLNNYPDIGLIDTFVVLNDDLIRLIEAIGEDREVEEVFRFSSARFKSICGAVEDKTIEEINKKYSLNENVAGTTLMALLMTKKFFALTEAKDLIFPDLSMSQAVIERETYHDDEDNGQAVSEELRENIVSSAVYLGRKYRYAEDHSLHVTKLALSIFDQIMDIYGMPFGERLYLEVAGILHDIGTFVNPSSHHKHSQVLIASSEIFGLTQSDMNIISLIARYHRKSPPKPSHIEYMALPMNLRVIVSRLSAILRVADALDNIHTQIIEDVKVSILDTRCEMLVKIKIGKIEYFDIIKNAVKSKGDLFELFFGVPISLEIKV